ncbi:GntR family transcriptional regulator [Actinosynnema sp. NPDC059797]
MFQTKAEFAYHEVRQRVLTGAPAPGAVINQGAPAEEIGISTTPLREALKRLKAEGLVELGAHRDARVAEQRAEEARDLLEVRRALDPLAGSVLLGTAHLCAGLVSALLALRAASSMVSRLLLGRLGAAPGRKRLLVGSVVPAALGVGQPLTMSWPAEPAPPGARGRAMSLRLTGNRAGQVVIPAAVGAAAAGLGAAGVLGVTAVAPA